MLRESVVETREVSPVTVLLRRVTARGYGILELEGRKAQTTHSQVVVRNAGR